MKKGLRPVGHINVHDPRGYAFIPQLVRTEVGVEGKGRIPFILASNLVLLIRRDTPLEDLLKGLDILQENLKLRWKVIETK